MVQADDTEAAEAVVVGVVVVVGAAEAVVEAVVAKDEVAKGVVQIETSICLR